MGGWTSWKMGS